MKLNNAAEAEKAIQKEFQLIKIHPLGYAELDFWRLPIVQMKRSQIQKSNRIDSENIESREAFSTILFITKQFEKAEQTYKELVEVQK